MERSLVLQEELALDKKVAPVFRVSFRVVSG